MNLDDWHQLFVSICLVLILIACTPLVLALIPDREEPFLALAILGEEGIAEHYFQGNDPQIEVGEEVHWTISLYNHMGETQYVTLKVKLINATMVVPNSTACVPSPAPVIYNVRRILLTEETWLFPLSWSVSNVEQVGDFVYIRSLSMNGKSVETESAALYGSNFRLVFELWVYDDFEDLRFGWVYGEELRCTWNQIWFSVV